MLALPSLFPFLQHTMCEGQLAEGEILALLWRLSSRTLVLRTLEYKGGKLHEGPPQLKEALPLVQRW